MLSFKCKSIISPKEVLESHSIFIDNEIIKEVRAPDKGPDNGKNEIHYLLEDYIMYPALVNAHDHLLGSYLPKVGTRRPYINWEPWDVDLKNSSIYEERGKNTNIDIYYLGAYKNLLSGVLTVSDHIPHSVNDQIIPHMPIRVLKDYSLAHEVSNFDLNWGDGVEIEHNKAVRNNEPFITHIEEGFDSESMKGIEYLMELGALTENTVLIHGIALSDIDIKNIAVNRANLVWCPVSNFYMFERTGRVKEWKSAGVNISIGTDSPMSGSLNILEEIKFAKKIYKEMYNEALSDKEIVEMITINPAKALRIDKFFGSIEVGKKAEFILLRNSANKDPYSLLVETNLEDIALIFYKGKPFYGNEEFFYMFDDFKLSYNKFNLNGVKKIIAYDNPLDLLYKIRNAVGYKKEFAFLPIS